MKTALIVVDVQNDFCEGGPLAVTGGASLAQAITTYLAHGPGSKRYSVFVTSQDWHNALPDTNDGHFATGAPDWVSTWPVHCVAGTPGADLHPDLRLPRVDIRVRKGQGRQDYSAFDGTPNGLSRITLTHFLREAGVKHIDVVGLATDHCVKATALAARSAGFDVTVLRDLTAGVATDTTHAAIAEMSAAGIQFRTAEETA